MEWHSSGFEATVSCTRAIRTARPCTVITANVPGSASFLHIARCPGDMRWLTQVVDLIAERACMRTFVYILASSPSSVGCEGSRIHS